MQFILIDPLNHTKTSEFLTSKRKKKCLQFFRAKSELLDDFSDDIELLELLTAELNEIENQTHTKTEYSNAIQMWKSSITLNRPTDSNYVEDDEQLRQMLCRLNAQIVEPTKNQLNCVLRCFETNLKQSSLWSRLAAPLNILSNTRYSIPFWQRTFEQFTSKLVAKKSLSNYLTNKYGKSPLSLTKSEQRFLKESADRVAPYNDNLILCCRICLASDNSEMIYIHDHGVNSADASLLDKLKVSGCFDVVPELEHNLPKFICKSCSLLIDSAYQLRMLCLKNEEKLREMVSQKDQFMNEHFDSECHGDESEIDYKDSWNNHKAVHKKIKDFKCTECNFATNTIYNLRVHERTHRDIQAYACKYCKMKFKTASNLLKHMRGVHLKQRSLKCDQCECAYFNRESLRRHTVIHTGHRPFDCAAEGCNQNYLWYSGLRKHMLQFHAKDNVTVPTEKYYLDKLFGSMQQK